jgi:acyl-CoA thioester hydrolase
MLFSLPLQVRYYECDAYGHLNHVNYLRYMETAAFAAAAAAGFDYVYYRDAGLAWLVRETDITYHAPLGLGDQVEVTTWVENFRRVRSRRRYVFYRRGEDAPVAEAATEWVLVDAAHRPVSVPPEMIAAFLPPDGAQPPMPPAAKPARFPDPPPQPDGTYRMRRVVEWRDVDPAGHVNNAVYLNYMESCSIAMMREAGWSMQRASDSGFAMVARRYRIEYRRQATVDDELEVATWFSDVRRATAVRHYAINRAADGELLTRGRCLYVWVDAESGRPRRIPPEFLAAYAANRAADDR